MLVVALDRTDVPRWFLILTAAVFGLVGVFLSRLWRTHRRRLCLVLAGLIYFSFAFWVVSSPPLVIYYGEKPLKDGQKLKLTSLTDKSRRPLQMFVQPELNLFGVVGISARNAGGKALEADSVHLSFSAPVAVAVATSGPWQLSPDRNVEGWTTFRADFGVNSIQSGHPLPIPELFGTPIPTKEIEVRLTIEYGTEEAKSEFTLAP
jgi:hypothetical protein